MLPGMDVSIGELAAHTGVPVRTIRHYSDLGLVPEAGRSASGYRRYDADSLARLELVRALRDLGLDLATAGRVAALQTSLEAVAAAQADAIECAHPSAAASPPRAARHRARHDAA